MDALTKSFATHELLNDVITGLNMSPKSLPCKHFYDERGSELFESICQTPEYYVTRTEIQILKDSGEEISQLIGKKANIIEPGAGSMKKAITLLSSLDVPMSYIPTDISSEFLFAATEPLERKFPAVEIKPRELNFNDTEELTQVLQSSRRDDDVGKQVIFFPGSTIGNFHPGDAREFLQNFSSSLEENDGMLIGVDLVKDVEILEAAYNDKQGITSAFNKNLLVRIKNELDADIELDQFTHQSVFNQEQSRIEMHLISTIDQTISVAGKSIHFEAGESIHTENSYKYKVQDFHELANEAGFKPERHWTDEQDLFSLHYLEVP